MSKLMIAVCYIYVRPDHILITHFDIAASVDHDIAIKIIRAAYTYSDVREIYVVWPQPASFGKSVAVTDYDLLTSAHAPAPLHAIFSTLLHAKDTIREQSQPARRATRDSHEDRFEIHPPPPFRLIF